MSGETVPVDGRFRVIPDARLPHLDSPGCEAYAVEDGQPGGKRFFALICGPELPPRIEYFTNLARVEKLPVLTPLAWTIAPWPAIGRERYVLVFEQPGGARLLPGPNDRIAPLREDEIFRKVFRPMIQVLEGLNARVIPHRAVRADNLFYNGELGDDVVLGECISAPAGYHQPLIYETLENAMASRSGRASGALSDDLYAFGVLLAVLLAGGDPCAGMSDEQIIASKIEKGSYATLIGALRTSLTMMEPLRGLLCDDPDGRWSIADLRAWLDGRALTPQQAPLPDKAARAFDFAGGSFTNLRSLAYAMARNWDDGCKAVKEGELAQWVKRSLPDKQKAERLFVRLVAAQTASRRGNDDELLASLLIAFDPIAPVRYRDLSFVPEALGQTLAIEFDERNMVETFQTIIASRLPNLWLDGQPRTRPEFVQLKKMLEMSVHLLHRSGWGFGVERCLYELNPEWPCRSPLFDGRIIADIARLLPTLERIATEGTPDQPPVDPHIAAYCAAHLKKLPDRALKALSTPDDAVRHRIGMVRLLATVQHLTAAPPLPALGRWCTRVLAPVVESFHSRPYRQELGREIQRAAELGDLTHMLALVDDESARLEDDRGYAKARVLYAKAEREINWLESGGLTDPKQVARGSGQAAVLLSTVLSGLALVILTMLHVS